MPRGRAHPVVVGTVAGTAASRAASGNPGGNPGGSPTVMTLSPFSPITGIISPSPPTPKKSFYDALSHPPDHNKNKTHEPHDIYRSPGQKVHGMVEVTMPMYGRVKKADGLYHLTNKFEIAYTVQGDRGPVVAFLHGVPTNRYQWFPVQELVAPFSRTISFDMLGMGESTKVRQYGLSSEGKPIQMIQHSAVDANGRRIDLGKDKPWDWKYDIDWVEQVMQKLFGNEEFFFVADDWGGGINAHYAARFDSNRLLGFIQLDPIAFDGYPVGEIQAIGRASQIADETQFQMLMGAIDQTMNQIFKTMVYDPNVYNQYTLRDIKKTYIDVDYERSAYRDGEDADSLTLRLKWEAIHTLTERAAILAPSLLLPHDKSKNPKGVQWDRITVPTLIMWGKKDNMMPENQKDRYHLIMPNASVQATSIPRAGHFAAMDQPDIVAEELIRFFTRVMGVKNMGDIFLGYTGIWKGDEEDLIADMREIYGMTAS